MKTLLPPNRTVLETALEQAISAEIDPSAIATLWDPHTCPIDVLPWLAWAFSVDDWDDTWRETVKRAVVAESIETHKLKGTVSAIRRVFTALGFGAIEIDEGRSGHTRDGRIRRDGWAYRAPYGVAWAWYRIRMSQLLPVRMAATARVMLAANAPARCHLYEIDYTAARLVRNGYARRDGTYTRGIA